MKRFAPALVFVCFFFEKYGLALKIQYTFYDYDQRGADISRAPCSISEWCLKAFQLQGSNSHSTDLKPPQKKISTMSSFPPPEVLSPVCVGCHPQPSEPLGRLRPRPIPAACGLGRLPAVPADMCSSKRWMNNGAVQPGGVFFFHPFPDQCVHGAAPVAYSTGKLSQELPHNSQKRGCSNKISTLGNALEWTTWLWRKRKTQFSAVAWIQSELLVSDSDNYAITMWLLMNNLPSEKRWRTCCVAFLNCGNLSKTNPCVWWWRRPSKWTTAIL